MNQLKLTLLQTLQENKSGLTIQEFRAKIPQSASSSNENLSRRLRELRRNYHIPFEQGKYIYRGTRSDPTMDDGHVPERLRSEVFHRDGHRCCFCGKNPVEDGAKLQADHMTPHSHGGTTTLDNLQTLCETCNRSKKNHFTSFQSVSKVATPDELKELLANPDITSFNAVKMGDVWNCNFRTTGE